MHLRAAEPASAPHPRTVHATDRAWDLAALALIAAGAGLFAVARGALHSLAAGSYVPRGGTTFVASTDHHVTQSTMAVAIIGAGVLVGIIAAVRHGVRKRQSEEGGR